MNREEALRQAQRANSYILVAIGALALASLNTTKIVRYLQGVMPRGEIISVADQEPEDTKAALEEMVENYYESVN